MLQNTPTAFNRVILTVVGRVIGKANVDLMALNKIHHAAEELASSTAVFWAIVLKQNQSVDLGKPGLVFAPPVLEGVYDTIAGDFGCADRDRQLVMLWQQEAEGRRFGVGLVIVVERSDRWHATFSVA